MPLVSRASLRKRWRYVGFYGDRVMLCAAWAEVGPFRSTFWSLWDREEGQILGHTRLRPGTPELTIDGDRLELSSGSVRASLRLGESEPVEVVCPSGRGWGWTSKRAGVPLTGTIEAEGRRWTVDGVGVDDQSAGYQARHTRWSWSAGVGRTVDGRDIAWNLTAGINDPIHGSERAIWIDGEPFEPEPVVFTGLDTVGFLGGDRLDFQFGESAATAVRVSTAGGPSTAESPAAAPGPGPPPERRRHDNYGLIRSDYVHRFGTFTGTLPLPGSPAAESPSSPAAKNPSAPPGENPGSSSGENPGSPSGSGAGIELAEATGVMEEHIAVW
jgi:hypothetical protein